MMLKNIPVRKLRFYFLLLCLVFLMWGEHSVKPKEIHGDGIEYTLMTEAFYNHFSPNVTQADCELFKKRYEKHQNWHELNRYSYIDLVSTSMAKKKPKFGGPAGFYSDGNHFYAIHFWFYSLINVPAYFICDIFHLDPILSFILTNIFLLFCTIVLLTLYNPFENKRYLFFLPALMVLLSPVIWYVGWGHAEVYLISFTLSGLWMYFFLDKKYIGILLLAIAALQNQTIAVVVLFLCIDTIIQNGLKIKTLLKLFMVSVWVLLPGIFYYTKFDVFSLVSYTHQYNIDLISVAKFFSLLFDIDQGTIIGYPLLIFSYILLLILFFRKRKNCTKQNIRVQGLLLGSFLVLSIIVTGMWNWNHGMSIINRYSVWISVFLIAGFFHLLKGVKPMIGATILSLNILLQAALVFYFGAFNAREETSSYHNIFAQYVLKNCPNLYSPNYQIFIVRTLKFYPIEYGQIPYLAYFYNNNHFSKLILSNNHLDALDSLCKKGVDVSKLKERLKNEDKPWVYVNREDNVIDNKKMLSANIKLNIKLNEERIYASTVWLSSEKKKAKKGNISLKEQVKRDALYVYKLSKSDYSNGLK